MHWGTQASPGRWSKGEMKWAAHGEPCLHNANGMSWQAEWKNRRCDYVWKTGNREITGKTQQATVTWISLPAAAWQLTVEVCFSFSGIFLWWCNILDFHIKGTFVELCTYIYARCLQPCSNPEKSLIFIWGNTQEQNGEHLEQTHWGRHVENKKRASMSWCSQIKNTKVWTTKWPRTIKGL